MEAGHYISDMPPKPGKIHENLGKALVEAPLRSPMGKWMVRQHSELEALFREKGEPDWAKVAEVFAKAGLWDENDQRPTAESVERTWRVVRASAVSPSAPT